MLPYRFSYADGKFEAALAGAKLAWGDLAPAREGGSDSFATLTRPQVEGLDADLARREATVAEVRAEGGRLAVRRDAKGELDVIAAAAGPAAAAPARREVAVDDWKLAVKQVLLDDVALAAVDETVNPPARLDAGRLRPQLQATAQQTGANLQVPLLQRVGKMIQGEPQVADAGAFYGKLIERLNREQPLPAGALAQLGPHRADAVLAALQEGGVDPAPAGQ